jgi:sec-independent protein translocase protein TatA
MGTFSIWHWLIVLAIVLILFGGRGKLPALARDFAKSITSFKKGLKDSDDGGGKDEEEAVTSIKSQAEPAAKDEAAKG